MKKSLQGHSNLHIAQPITYKNHKNIFLTLHFWYKCDKSETGLTNEDDNIKKISLTDQGV